MGQSRVHAEQQLGRTWQVADVRRLIDSLNRAPGLRMDDDRNRLTPREREVARLLVQDMSVPRISAVMGISPDTIRSHLDHILAKLGLHSRAQLVLWMHRHGDASLRHIGPGTPV
jgi:DNA-binding CsgD family transcriptional regulator